MKEKKKILIITDNNISTVGGEQESTKIILDAIKDKYNVSLVQPGSSNLISPSFKMISVSKKDRLKYVFKNPFNILLYIALLIKIIFKEKPDIIHTQSQVSFFVISLLLKLNIFKDRAVLIHTERGLYSKYGSFFKKIFSFSFKRLDFLILTTHLNFSYWEPIAKKANKNLRLKVIENTAGPLFEKSAANVNVQPIKNKLVVGFAGRYCDWKNWPLALEISKSLLNIYGDDFHVHAVAGCLDEKSKKEANAMFNSFKEVLGDNFFGYINLSLKEMIVFYDNVDVFIVTSDYGTESFGRTVVEAMSKGCLVLSTDCGGPKEIIGNSDFILSSAKDFAEKASCYMRNPEALNEIKLRNKMRVIEHYSHQNNLSKHFSIYEEAVSEN